MRCGKAVVESEQFEAWIAGVEESSWISITVFLLRDSGTDVVMIFKSVLFLGGGITLKVSCGVFWLLEALWSKIFVGGTLFGLYCAGSCFWLLCWLKIGGNVAMQQQRQASKKASSQEILIKQMLNTNYFGGNGFEKDTNSKCL